MNDSSWIWINISLHSFCKAVLQLGMIVIFGLEPHYMKQSVIISVRQILF